MAEKTVEPDVTSGWKTSEFASVIASSIAFAVGAIPTQYAPIVGGVIAVYVACRTLLKAAHSFGYVKQIPDLPALPIGTTSTTITTRQP